ncbi:MAG TPA: GNAT family N-acetyltransferase [Gemmatimonadaceae bacterium]
MVARPWRPTGGATSGPHLAQLDEIGPLNQVFSDAFTDRYRKDGMVGVRVPFLNPLVWRYAIEDAAAGAMLWRDERGGIVAFNMVHRSGAEGWMGPLAVKADYQGSGLGKEVVQRGIHWLREQGVRVLGLETMPRTMDNIGFYSGLGFIPGRLTVTLTVEALNAPRGPLLLRRQGNREREETIAECRALVGRLAPGYDYTREIELTESLALGDTVLLRDAGGALVGFALCHTAPLVEGRTREELRVLKLVLDDMAHFDAMVASLRDFARASGTRRVAMRVQGEYEEAYRQLVAMGARVRWTDLRMALRGFEERTPARGMILSNWEI